MTSQNPEPKIFALIVAAGSGRRMGHSVAKQYLPLLGQPLLAHSLQTLLSWPRLTGLTLVLAAEDPQADAWQSRFPAISLQVGGVERADSVQAGLNALAVQASDQDWVLVQDAARPCLTQHDLEQLWHAVQQDEVGGLLATPVRDTLKRADQAGQVAETVNRQALWHALTPQMFRYGLLCQALQQAQQSGICPTDEAQAIELLGYRPKLVEGRSDNLKVTYPQDLVLAELYLAAQRSQGLR